MPDLRRGDRGAGRFSRTRPRLPPIGSGSRGVPRQGARARWTAPRRSFWRVCCQVREALAPRRRSSWPSTAGATRPRVVREATRRGRSPRSTSRRCFRRGGLAVPGSPGEAFEARAVEDELPPGRPRNGRGPGQTSPLPERPPGSPRRRARRPRRSSAGPSRAPFQGVARRRRPWTAEVRRGRRPPWWVLEPPAPGTDTARWRPTCSRP